MMSGFLGTRSSFMMDVVVVAMVVVLPVLAWSCYQVKSRKAYKLHRSVQLVLAAVLGVAVVLFEVEIRFLVDWRENAEPSPHYDTLVFPALWVHLFFAVSTSLLWIATVVHALRHTPKPPGPSEASRSHANLAWASVFGMFGTAITGWVFYWIAFAAT